MERLDFGEYLLNESKDHLSRQVGDVLTALQSLGEDGPNMGNRQVMKAAKGIGNQIRRILHDTWPDTEKSTLLSLQKVGVALLKAIDSNDDINDVIANATSELEGASGDMETPVNDLASQDESPSPGS